MSQKCHATPDLETFPDTFKSLERKFLFQRLVITFSKAPPYIHNSII
nr:MAG TPA: hypothetical protein [Caudoviricetes sp.]